MYRLQETERARPVVQLPDSVTAVLLDGMAYTLGYEHGIENPLPSLILSYSGHDQLTLRTVDGSLSTGWTTSPSLRSDSTKAAPRSFPLPERVLGVLGFAANSAGSLIEEAQRRLKALGVTDFVNMGVPTRGVTGTPNLSSHIEHAGPFRNAVVDDTGFRDGAALARAILDLAASGCPVTTQTGNAPPWLFGSELAESLVPDRTADRSDAAWMSLASRQKTAAWIDHRVALQWEDGGNPSPVVARVGLPTVSILLSTMRPELLPVAMEMISNQRDVPIEVHIAIHGGSESDIDSAKEIRTSLGLEGSEINPSPELPLGVVLNLLARRASGLVLTKWDDDDLYGPNHLRDLLAARLHSGADLVGKAPEFIFLQDANMTVLRNPQGAESESTVIAGGTLLTGREAFWDVGGFPPTVRAIDHYLKHEYRRRGLRVFRTHGFGFVLVRHAMGHTWNVDENQFRMSGELKWVGVPKLAAV